MVAEVKPLRILVADDVEDNRVLIKLYLKNCPYHLEFAQNGLQVLEKMAALPPFDLILMDLNMPQMGGLEATRIIREKEKAENRPAVGIIALTASSLKEDEEKTMAAGCDLHLAKFLNRDALQQAILQVMEAKQK